MYGCYSGVCCMCKAVTEMSLRLYFCMYVCRRLMLMDSVDRPQLWNIFNQVTIHSQDVRHHRFCLRLLLKNPDNHALCVLNGHNGFVSGSFKHALGTPNCTPNTPSVYCAPNAPSVHPTVHQTHALCTKRTLCTHSNTTKCTEFQVGAREGWCRLALV